nr:tail fiber assembly protein [Xenorhabdus sp. BG5]
MGSTGTLVHPTLGELTVSVTESGLRMTESAESGRVFEFTLTVIESGLKFFAVTNSTKSATAVGQNWLRTYTTMLAKYVSMVRGEIRSVVQGIRIRIIRQTADQWIGMVTRSVDDVPPPPPPTPEELQQQAEYEKRQLLDTARVKIDIYQDAVDLDMATDAEKSALTAWRKYRVLLNRVDCATAPDIQWPEQPK